MPALAGAIVFSDQHWDRFVNRDFQRLEPAPPKVIVIGPRNSWRNVHRSWGNDVRGCARLIDLVQKRLLPDRYLLQVANPIMLTDYAGPAGHEGSMDVYVCNDGGERAGPRARGPRAPGRLLRDLRRRRGHLSAADVMKRCARRCLREHREYRSDA